MQPIWSLKGRGSERGDDTTMQRGYGLIWPLRRLDSSKRLMHAKHKPIVKEGATSHRAGKSRMEKL
jgi:hypothetical protein